MRTFFSFASLAFAAASQATIIYDTFGPGNTYDTGNAWGLSDEESIGIPFSVTGDKSLNTLDLALTGSSTDYTISIRYGGSTTPGASIYSWTVSAPSDGVYSLAPTGAVLLPTGDYYVRAENDAAFGGGWFWNSIGFTGTRVSNYGGTWHTFGGTTSVMRIDATAVPEPASLAALGLGATALLRRRKKV
jgi:hypothetical protein